jgi:hypothetical protein
MKRHNLTKREGGESMQRMHSMVLGLIVAFALGGSLVLLGCGGGNGTNTTGIDASNAAAQLGGKSFVFTGDPIFGTNTPSLTLTFNNDASRFAFTGSNFTNTAVGKMSYGSCIFTVDGSNFPSPGPQVGNVFTANPCETDQNNNNNLIINNVTSTSNGPAVTGTGGSGQ